ncbi:MAG: hypothetical protein PHF72_11350 [Gammaproteobacteria bacterium]|nr:hypothetical protein [Gammaproteobacteria bacterium]
MLAVNMILMALPAILAFVAPVLVLLSIGDWLRDEYKWAHSGGRGRRERPGEKHRHGA